MADPIGRWQRKYTALAAGYVKLYGANYAALPHAGVCLGLGPAQLETKCGDAWPGPDGLVDTADDERNWGACTLRGLNAAEAKVLANAHIWPTIGKGHENVARAAMAALAAAGLPPASGPVAGGRLFCPSATLHCDSHTVKNPVTGKSETIPHFAWFANFTSDEDGAAYYLHMLGSTARAVLARGGTAHELASAMYAKYYYGGFHPRGTYVAKDGTTHDGNAENIAAYESNICYWLPVIHAALDRGSQPLPSDMHAHVTLRLGAHGADVSNLQHLLNAHDGHAELIPENGTFDALTEQAVREFQAVHGLEVDGVVGKYTWAVLTK
jgi:peptidoglycan hydrolase-like protein with peptidoglycan-binding domain